MAEAAPPTDRPLARGWIVALPFVVYLVVAAVALGVIGGSRFGGDEDTRFYHPLYGLAALVTYGLLVAGVVVVAQRFGPTGAVLGLRRTPPWRAARLVVGAFVVVALASWLVLEPLLHGTEAQDVTPGRFPGGLAAGLGVALVTLTFVVAAPFAEELYFRGLLLPALGGLAPGRRGLLGVLLCGLVFAAIHLVPRALPALWLLGSLLALLVRRTGSIWPAIALHAVNNAIATALAFGQGWT